MDDENRELRNEKQQLNDARGEKTTIEKGNEKKEEVRGEKGEERHIRDEKMPMRENNSVPAGIPYPQNELHGMQVNTDLGYRHP